MNSLNKICILWIVQIEQEFIIDNASTKLRYFSREKYINAMGIFLHKWNLIMNPLRRQSENQQSANTKGPACIDFLKSINFFFYTFSLRTQLCSICCSFFIGSNNIKLMARLAKPGFPSLEGFPRSG